MLSCCCCCGTGEWWWWLSFLAMRLDVHFVCNGGPRMSPECHTIFSWFCFYERISLLCSFLSKCCCCCCFNLQLCMCLLNGCECSRWKASGKYSYPGCIPLFTPPHTRSILCRAPSVNAPPYTTHSLNLKWNCSSFFLLARFPFLFHTAVDEWRSRTTLVDWLNCIWII